MSYEPKKIFFAYESGHPEMRDSIAEAIADFNRYQSTHCAQSWEDLRVGGTIINKSIMSAIIDCDVFACDLTYINHNVMFELGFAIGQRRRILAFLDPTVTAAEARYKRQKVLRGIAYEPYTSKKEILAELNAKYKAQIKLLEQVARVEESERNTKDLLFVSSRVETQAALDLKELLVDLPMEMISVDKAEVEYQTLQWYIKSINQVKNVIIHLVGQERDGHHEFNSESSFFSGLACAFGKRVLLLAQAPFNAPIDYEDILLEYQSATECALKAEEWLGKRDKTAPGTAQGPQQQREDALLRLGIGDPQAQYERDGLQKYFIEFEAYKRARDGASRIITGRKGAGKTALFLKLEQEYSGVPDNYNIVLKPEAEELLANVELTDLYNSPRSKKTFLNCVWRFVFYTRILATLAGRLRPKADIPHFQPRPEESAILELSEAKKDLLSLNFFGAVRLIHQTLDSRSVVDNPQLLESLFENHLGEIVKVVQAYFATRKYSKINILADNLDKAWESTSNLGLQAAMILALIEFSERMINEIGGAGAFQRSRIVILLRKDIFDFLLREAPEPDKLLSIAYEINWERHPALLKRLIEERFRYALQMRAEDSMADVWENYFRLGDDPFRKIRSAVIARPRDLVYFVTRLFESAVDASHDKVTDDDFKYACEAYTEFLEGNLMAEVKAEYPAFPGVYQEVESQADNLRIEHSQLRAILKAAGMTPEGMDELLENLFQKDYLVGISEFTPQTRIRSLRALRFALAQRKWVIWKNRVFLTLNPVAAILRSGGLPFA